MELNPIAQLRPEVILAVIGITTVMYFVLRKILFIPLIEVMDRREARIEHGQAMAAEAEQVRVEAEARAEQVVAEARQAGTLLVEGARAKAEVKAQAKLETAREEAERILARGREETDAVRETELAKLKAEAIECVGLACKKLVGDVPAPTIESTIDGLMARRLH